MASSGLDERVKRAVLMNGVPDPLREHLVLNSQTYGTFAAVKHAIEDYLANKRWPNKQKGRSADAMEVDFFDRKGNGKDRDKGKGKGKGAEKGKNKG